MTQSEQWYAIQQIDALDSPALVVFPDRVKHNIEAAIEMVGEVKRLRPHVKTHKSPDVTRLMIDAGITDFKCATIAEAEMLAQCKAKDVLLAYQPLGPKLHRFIELIRKYPETQFSCLTDNKEALYEQAGAFADEDLLVPLYIDLNIGMNRTGIAPGTEAVSLYREINTLKSVKAAGLHAYDGHLRSKDLAERTEQCNKGFAAVEQMVEELRAQGLPVPNVIAGGSPSFPIHAKRKGVQCSPGTFVYWDYGYLTLCPEQPFQPAAVLVTRVISLPAPGRICTDLGHKSVASENEISRRIHFLNATGLTPVGQSEEHLVLETAIQHPYRTGDVLYGLPFHICPTVALYDRLITIQNGLITGEWKTIARDRKITV